jgi:hypothetical protein
LQGEARHFKRVRRKREVRKKLALLCHRTKIAQEPDKRARPIERTHLMSCSTL